MDGSSLDTVLLSPPLLLAPGTLFPLSSIVQHTSTSLELNVSTSTALLFSSSLSTLVMARAQ